MLRDLCSEIIFKEIFKNDKSLDDLNILDHYKNILKDYFNNYEKKIKFNYINIINKKTNESN